MRIEFQALSDFGLVESADLLRRAFEDYFVRIQPTQESLCAMARIDSVSFGDSRVVLADGKAVGAGLVARRGWTSRLAGMALLPEARGRGIGRALMAQLLTEARDRGDRRYGLEVIEQNAPAVRLYERMGFSKRRRLVGFAVEGAQAEVGDDVGLREVDLREMGAGACGNDFDWPWQISGETLAQLTPPMVAYELDGARVALSAPGQFPQWVRGLYVNGHHRRDERAIALLRAVMARHPAAEWRISAVWPEEFGHWFTQVGWRKTELSQWQMAQNL